jgi:hypothetical protein
VECHNPHKTHEEYEAIARRMEAMGREPTPATHGAPHHSPAPRAAPGETPAGH